MELYLYIASSELFSFLLATYNISREVYLRRHTSVYEILSLAHIHTLSRSNGRGVGYVESPRVFTNTRRALLSYLSPHVRAVVVTGQMVFGAKEFSATPKAYLYAVSLFRSRCSAMDFSSATLLVEDDDYPRCGTSCARAVLPVLYTLGTMPFACCIQPGDTEVIRGFI